jgi:WD40 repeat protein
LAYSPDGKRIAIGNTIKIIKLVDAETGRELLKLTGHSAAVHTLAFSPDGKRLASASAQPTEQGKLLGEIKLWDTQTGEEIFSLDGGTRGMAFSPDGTLVAGASGDWNRAGESARGLSLKVWDAQTGKELHDLKEQRVVTSMCFSRDSKRLAYATRLSGRPAGSIPPPQSSAQLKIWDVAKGEEQIA